MPLTTCLLCHGPIRLRQDELNAQNVPAVGPDCLNWLAKGLGLEGIRGIAESLEQTLMVYCVEAAVEAGFVGQAARDEADRMVAVALEDLYRKYITKFHGMPPRSAPSVETP